MNLILFNLELKFGKNIKHKILKQDHKFNGLKYKQMTLLKI